MKAVTEKEYEAFKETHNIDKTSLKVEEHFPCGSWNRIFYMGVNRKVKMCLEIHDTAIGSHYYIY